ncbi:MAG: DNA polymerase I [Lentisphaerae bacterium]|jgi:DNA polymerase-1|nr:DNA polymerase I [Lentisphaerota bacterium]
MEQELQTPQAESALYVIDAMPLLYRGHFVFLKKPRLTTTGINTSALTAFAGSVLQLIETRQPSHIVLVFDSTTPTFRHELYPEYKAQRQKMPEDLAASIPMAKELADALRIPSLRVDGYEADDLMGTLARQAGEAGMTTFLVTPDKDIAQLVTATTFLYRPGKQADAAEIYGRDEVSRRWGVREPGQMIDLLAMAGDSSDNIPGIRGVGEKTAQALLAQYGSLEEVLAHAGELKGKLAEKVAESAEAARMSYQLATIRQDVPLPCTIDDLKAQPPDREALRQVLSKYELLKMGRRLLGDDFTLESQTPDVESIATRPHTYTCVTDEAGLAALADELGRATRWAFDTETTGLDPWNSRLVGVSFATAPGKAWYVPVPVGGKERERVLQWLRPRFDDPRPIRIAHNAKFDLTVLRQHGVPVGGICHDTMLTHYVLDASERHSLDYLARQLLNYDTIPISSLIGDGKGGDGPTMGDLAPGAVSDYACEDADVTLRLYEHLRPEATRAGLLKALEDSEEPLVPVLIEMEAEGVRIDRSVLDEYSKELDRELLQLELSIRELAGGGFNLNSPKQLGEVLFDRLKLDPDAARTSTGQYATNEDVLQKLVGRHPIIEKILDYRAASKLKSTYVDKLPECINPATGRVHTTFSQAVTETGRLASSDPNLQNIPIRTERGRRIRASFVARDDNHVLVSADYSQVELRVAASLSRDKAMLDAFAAGADIHAATAARVYDVEPLFVTPEMRERCKMVNFGIIYGMSAFGLAQRLNLPRKQAGELIEAYFERYPGIRRYMEQSIDDARARGYARTVLGRRRYLRDINSRNATARQAAERFAINTPVQGTAADLIKLAMVRVAREINAAGMKSRLVLQIHDELLFDVPRDEEPALRKLVREAMSGALDLGVPLEVQLGSGRTWLDAH